MIVPKPQVTEIGRTGQGSLVWAPTHRHTKGGLYRLLGYGTLEADRTTVAIYDDASGAVWVRSAAEFDDGRFELITDAQSGL